MCKYCPYLLFYACTNNDHKEHDIEIHRCPQCANHKIGQHVFFDADHHPVVADGSKIEDVDLHVEAAIGDDDQGEK